MYECILLYASVLPYSPWPCLLYLCACCGWICWICLLRLACLLAGLLPAVYVITSVRTLYLCRRKFVPLSCTCYKLQFHRYGIEVLYQISLIGVDICWPSLSRHLVCMKCMWANTFASMLPRRRTMIYIHHQMKIYRLSPPYNILSMLIIHFLPVYFYGMCCVLLDMTIVISPIPLCYAMLRLRLTRIVSVSQSPLLQSPALHPQIFAERVSAEACCSKLLWPAEAEADCCEGHEIGAWLVTVASWCWER